MNNLFFIDFMLENEKVLYISLLLIIVLGYYVCNKLNVKGLFLLAIFIAIKIGVHTYIDDYIDSKKQLKKFKHLHVVSITILVSLLISFPAIIISKIMGIRHI
jgi:hypothetical protein